MTLMTLRKQRLVYSSDIFMMALHLDFKKHKRHRLKNYVSYDSYDPYDSSENPALQISQEFNNSLDVDR